MITKQIDVHGIGNAIVDVIARADDDFLATHGITKGAMRLIEEDTAEKLYHDMGPGTEISGGSCANTMAGIASFGGTGAYTGKVRDDQLGAVFSHDIRALKVGFDTAVATDGPATARCLILVTPDGERSMNTYLGACVHLGPEEVDKQAIKAAKVLYLEGYLWDRDEAKAAFRLAADTAREVKTKVSLTLSDSFCVDRHREGFLDLVRGKVDILFANEAEILSLYQTGDFDAAVNRIREDCSLAVLTRSEKGCVIVSGDDTIAVPAKRVDKVVDATGAGDMFAAGFLYGYTTGKDLTTCGSLGVLAAAEIISHIGARPEVSLAELAKNNGLV